MTAFLAVARKEVRLLLRDRAFLVLELVCPLLLLLVFGTVFSVTLRATPVAVADREGSAASRALAAELGATALFAPAAGDLEAALASGRALAAVEIAAGYGAGRGRDGAPRATVVVDGSHAGAAAAAAALAATLTATLTAHGPAVAAVTWYNPARRDAIFFVPGVIALILFAGAAIFPALSLAREKDGAGWQILCGAPISDGALLAGKLVPYVVQTALIAAACFALARLAFGLPCRGSGWLLGAGTGLFLVASVGLGAALAALASGEDAVWRMLQLGVLLPGFVLSGFVYPVSSMPPVAAALSRLLPARPYLDLLRAVALKGASARAVAEELVILAGFAVAALAAATVLLRRARRAA